MDKQLKKYQDAYQEMLQEGVSSNSAYNSVNNNTTKRSKVNGPTDSGARGQLDPVASNAPRATNKNLDGYPENVLKDLEDGKIDDDEDEDSESDENSETNSEEESEE